MKDLHNRFLAAIRNGDGEEYVALCNLFDKDGGKDIVELLEYTRGLSYYQKDLIGELELEELLDNNKILDDIYVNKLQRNEILKNIVESAVEPYLKQNEIKADLNKYSDYKKAGYLIQENFFNDRDELKEIFYNGNDFKESKDTIGANKKDSLTFKDWEELKLYYRKNIFNHTGINFDEKRMTDNVIKSTYKELNSFKFGLSKEDYYTALFINTLHNDEPEYINEEESEYWIPNYQRIDLYLDLQGNYENFNFKNDKSLMETNIFLESKKPVSEKDDVNSYVILDSAKGERLYIEYSSQNEDMIDSSLREMIESCKNQSSYKLDNIEIDHGEYCSDHNYAYSHFSGENFEGICSINIPKGETSITVLTEKGFSLEKDFIDKHKEKLIKNTIIEAYKKENNKSIQEIAITPYTEKSPNLIGFFKKGSVEGTLKKKDPTVADLILKLATNKKNDEYILTKIDGSESILDKEYLKYKLFLDNYQISELNNGKELNIVYSDKSEYSYKLETKDPSEINSIKPKTEIVLSSFNMKSQEWEEKNTISFSQIVNEGFYPVTENNITRFLDFHYPESEVKGMTKEDH